jgi:hypothetical protein
MTDWRASLDQFFAKYEKPKEPREQAEFTKFLGEVVAPAFQQLREEMEKHGREVMTRKADASITIFILAGGEEELMYRIRGRQFPSGFLPYAEVRFTERKGLRKLTAESMFRSGTPTYKLQEITQDDIIRNFLDNYTRRVHAE